MRSKFEFQFDLLKEEYNNVQLSIRHYDSLLFVIKGWAITTYAGFIYLSIKEYRLDLMILSVLIPLFFWALDSLFKGFQARFVLRSRLIEDYLRSDRFDEDIKREDMKGIAAPDIWTPELKGRQFKDLLLSLKQLSSKDLDKLGACSSVDRTSASEAEADKSQEQDKEQENHCK